MAGEFAEFENTAPSSKVVFDCRAFWCCLESEVTRSAGPSLRRAVLIVIPPFREVNAFFGAPDGRTARAEKARGTKIDILGDIKFGHVCFVSVVSRTASVAIAANGCVVLWRHVVERAFKMPLSRSDDFAIFSAGGWIVQ